MKIEVNTTEKTIKILEDVKLEEILQFISTLKDGNEYKIIKTLEFVYHQYQPYYIYPSFYTTPNTGQPIITCGTTTTGTFSSGTWQSHNTD